MPIPSRCSFVFLCAAASSSRPRCRQVAYTTARWQLLGRMRGVACHLPARGLGRSALPEPRALSSLTTHRMLSCVVFNISAALCHAGMAARPAADRGPRAGLGSLECGSSITLCCTASRRSLPCGPRSGLPPPGPETLPNDLEGGVWKSSCSRMPASCACALNTSARPLLQILPCLAVHQGSCPLFPPKASHGCNLQPHGPLLRIRLQGECPRSPHPRAMDCTRSGAR